MHSNGIHSREPESVGQPPLRNRLSAHVDYVDNAHATCISHSNGRNLESSHHLCLKQPGCSITTLTKGSNGYFRIIKEKMSRPQVRSPWQTLGPMAQKPTTLGPSSAQRGGARVAPPASPQDKSYLSLRGNTIFKRSQPWHTILTVSDIPPGTKCKKAYLYVHRHFV